MLHDYAHVQARLTVLILGAAGNVGAYAVQLAANAGLHVLRSWVQKILNMCGGLEPKRLSTTMTETLNLPCLQWMWSLIRWAEIREIVRFIVGGILVSAVSPTPLPSNSNVRTAFFYLEVTTDRLNRISKLFDSKKLLPQVGTVLPISQVEPHMRCLLASRTDAAKLFCKSRRHSSCRSMF